MADCVRLTGVDSPRVRIDVIHLERALHRVTAATPQHDRGLADLIDALEPCSGTPLDGVDDDWAEIERERLAALRIRALSTAMRLLAAEQRYEEAIEIGRRILVLDPYRECALQEMLCLHVLNGQRPRALQFFDEFAAALEADLGITPMPETRALRDYLVSDRCLHNLALNESGVFGVWGAGVGPLLNSIEHTRDALRLRG